MFARILVCVQLCLLLCCLGQVTSPESLTSRFYPSHSVRSLHESAIINQGLSATLLHGVPHKIF